MSATEDESSGTVGVITAVEHTDGRMIPTGEIDGDVRQEWIDHLQGELAELDGVAEAWGAGNNHLNRQTGQFEVELEHSTPRWKDGVEIDTDLRSFAQRLRGVLEDSRFVSAYDVTLKPTSLGDGRHNHQSYVIEFWLV